jgi:aryl-alcohol dehydrogenase-like predicted oxidoreductase
MQAASSRSPPAEAAGSLSLGGDLTICRLGYGAMGLTGPGVWGPPVDRKAALQVLRRAVDLGITFIDAADSYGPGGLGTDHCRGGPPLSKGFSRSNKGGMRAIRSERLAGERAPEASKVLLRSKPSAPQD